MEGKLTPRQIAKELLNGVPPERPLVLPIVFALGTRIENVQRSEYVQSPTKIVGALRQVRNHLQVDGVACYFDRDLEVEALGAQLEYKSPGEPPEVHWNASIRPGEILAGLHFPEDAVRNGRIPVAAEVIRRLNAIPNREFLLMATVAGPMSLARKIAQREGDASANEGELPPDALEFASSMSAQTATALLEAGADLMLIYEDVPSILSIPEWEEWKNLVAPTINVARFYEALPVVQVSDASSGLLSWDRTHGLDGVLSLPASTASSRLPLENASRLMIGLALPLESLETRHASSEEAMAGIRELVASLRPCLITTDDDVPLKTDLPHLKRLLGDLATGLSTLN